MLDGEEKKSIRNLLKDKLNKRQEVLFAYIYGSFNDDLPFHDIDVGVYVAGLTESSVTEYVLELSSVLQAGSKVPVDVQAINFAPIPFRYHVLRGELLFERDEATRSLVLEQVVQRYLDIEPLRRRGVKEAFAA